MKLLDVNFAGVSWSQGQPDPDGGSGPIAQWGDWTTGAGSKDLIVPSGSGIGSGAYFRHWRGPGTNNNGGGIRLTPSKSSRVWFIRFIMRYSKAFQYANGSPHYTKEVYINCGQNPFTILGVSGGMVYVHLGNGSINVKSSLPWSAVCDGEYHEYQWLLDGVNGLAECTVDGTKVLAKTGINYGHAFTYALIGSNHNQAVQPTDEPVDYGEFVIDDAVMPDRIMGTAPPQAPPIIITCPTVAPVPAVAVDGALVSFPGPTVSGGTPPYTTTATPASGTLFPIGTTPVAVDVVDAAGVKASCGFSVDVQPLVPPQIGPQAILVSIVNGGLVVTPQ